MSTRTAPRIRAVFSSDVRENARQPDTPKSDSYTLVVPHMGELREAVTVRTHFNPRGSGMQPVRACVWIRPADSAGAWRSGKGSASGCGYHKESQAIADAFESAGVELYGNPYAYLNRGERPDLKKRFYFGGTGDSAYQEILEAVARAAGYRIRKGASIMVRG